MESTIEFLYNPVNIVLLAIAGYLIKQLLTSPPPPPAPKKMAIEIAPRDYTLAQLRKFDGLTPSTEHNGDMPIYFAVDGVVFDVTVGRKFYGPGIYKR